MQPHAWPTDLFVVSCPDPTLTSVTLLKWLMAFCCCAYVGKYEKGFVWSDQREKLTYMKPKDASRHRQGSASIEEVHWSLWLSLIPASQYCPTVHCAKAFFNTHFTLSQMTTLAFPEKPHKPKEFFEFPSYKNIVAIILTLQQTHWKKLALG